MAYKITIITEKWVSDINKSIKVEIEFTFDCWDDVQNFIGYMTDGRKEITVRIDRVVK